MRDPVLAAFFNIVPGAGYLYLNTRKPFAILLLISTAVGLVPFFIFFDTYKVDDPWIIASSSILQIALMVDAYMVAKQQNGFASKNNKTDESHK